MDVRMFTVGPVQENCFLVRADADATSAVIVDPGEEAPKLLGAIEALGVTLEAILLTHTHFDHIGAVAPVATATGAPVYCPAGEAMVMRDVMAYVPWPGFGPYDNWDPEHLLEGGEQLTLAGITFDVVSTPGHSPAHLTYATDGALFSGDVLFQGSIGRTDLPGGDLKVLMRSIQDLLERYPDETVVHPGHMGLTTLGQERRTNPFVLELQQ